MIKVFDWKIYAWMIPIMLFGLVTLFSFKGTEPIFWHQLLWITGALVVSLIIAQIDTELFKKTSSIVVLYVFGLATLVLVLLVGTTIKGSTSWINFGFFSFQPADLMKVFLILILSKYLSRRHIEIAHPKHIFITAIYFLIPFGLIMLQPDFGSGMVLFAIWFSMMLVSGISKKHLLIMFFLGLAAVGTLWIFVFKPYQKARIITFVNPAADIRGTGYNAYQSMIAVGSGQVTGKGVGYGTQSRLNFLPEYETDFIFAAFAEEWGFIGVSMLIICFLGLLLRLIHYAYWGESNFETLFAVGITMYFASHILVNMGMNMGVMPVTGIPLPFMSYGGSHMLAESLALGLVMGMGHYKRSARKDQIESEFSSL